MIKTEILSFSQQIDDAGPPPPNLKTKFKSVDGWLSKLCHTDHPSKPIQTFNFGLFESPKENIVFLVGTNTYQKQNGSITRNDYEPSDIFFRLPKKDYQNLTREELLDKLTSQLKAFTKTETFEHSFMAKADSITTDFKGEIWKR